MDNNLNFREVRDFNGVINGLFTFLKSDFKPLFKALLYYAGPLLLLAGIMLARYQTNMFSGNYDFNDPFAPYKGMVSGTYLLAILFSLMGNVAVMTVVYAHMALRDEFGPDGFTLDNVWDKVKAVFLSNLFATFVIGVLTVIAFFLIIAPGIYLMVAFSLVIPAMTLKGESMGEAISGSFQLIREHWWQTFGIIIVVSILVSIGSSIFTIPQMVLTTIYTIGSVSGEGASSPSLLFTMVTAIGTFFSGFMYSLLYIATGLQFYSLQAEKDGPDLYDRIDAINDEMDEKDSLWQ